MVTERKPTVWEEMVGLAPPKIPGIQPITVPQFITTPTGWTMTPDYGIFISPLGEQFTLAEMQARLPELGYEGIVYDYTRDLFVPATREQVTQREQTYKAMAGQLAELGIEGFVAPPGTPGAMTLEEYEAKLTDYEALLAEQRTRIEVAFQTVFPGTTIEDYQQLLAGMVVNPEMTEAEKTEANQAQAEFLTTIQQIGRTPETEFLLETIFPEATPEDINELFAQPSAETTETPKAVLGLEPEWLNVRTGEVIAASEKARRYPKGYEAELDEWVLTRETALNYGSVFRVFGESLTLLPKQWGAAILQAFQGKGGASVVDKDWADRWIEEASAEQEQFATRVAEKYGQTRLPISLVDLAELPQNMAFSLTSMSAGLAVGVPIGFLPFPGMRVAAWTLGTAASGAVAYNATTYQIMQQYLEVKNEEMLAKLGRGLTAEEENALKEDFSNQAIRYGLWEAIPEAISNLAFVRILTLPLGRMVGKTIASKILGKLVSIYGEELLTETITQKGQSTIEVEAGLREGRISWIEAFKEIAPQTFLLTTILGGMGQVGISSVNKIKQSLKKEIGESPIYDTIKENITPEVFAEVEAESQQAFEVAKEEAKITPVPEGVTPVTPEVARIRALETPAPEVASIQEKVMRGQSLTPAEQVIAKAEQGRFEALKNLSPQDASKLSDEGFQKWEYSRSPEEYRGADQLKAAGELHEALLLRGDTYTAKIVRGKIVTGALLPDGTFVANPEATAVLNRLEARAKTVIPKAEPEVIKPKLRGVKAIIEGKIAPSPPEGSATKRVFDRIQIESAEAGFTEKIRQGYHKFQVKMIDDLYSIKKFTESYTKGGVELSIEENPYLLARLLRGIASKANVFIEQGTFGKTFWKIEKGKAVPNFTGESLENILKEVKEPGVWQDFSTYLVARRSFELAARNIETGITKEDASAAVKELEAKHKNFPDLAKRVYKYQDNLLIYGREMGLLSEDLLGKLQKYGNYVPFYRVFNELQAKGFMGKKMADIASPIKKIKGSEREIINPLESIIKNTYVLISAADRNQVGIMMGNLVDKNPELADMFERVKTPIARVARVTAKELGVEIEGLSDEDAEAVVDIFRPSFFVRGDEVTVLIDGEKAYFKVDPDLRDGLLNLDRETMGILGKFLSLPAKWLRAGATLSPDFMVRNPVRDALTAFAYSNYNFLPGVDFMRGLASIIRKDADYQLYRASGAEHSMMVSMDREYLHKTFNEVVQGKKFTDYVKHPLELFQIVSELGEKATRLGEFKAGIRRGAVPLEAGYSARAVTLDFAQAGTTAHAINRLIAFFNANIRGWGRMFSSFREHPVRTSAKVFVGITLPSILLYFANRDDPRWKEIPQWQKDLFWIVMTKDNIYRIPKPFELGIIFGSMPERFLEWLDNKDPKLLKDVLVNFAEAGSPGFIPTFMLPLIENISNYSFFRGGKIVPASREKMPPELQYTRWTSEVSKKLGELLKLSPAKIDNLINGWTGGLGRYAIDILDILLKKTGISPDIPEPSPTLADIPVIKAFIVRNPYGSSGEAVESFYDTLEKYEQGEKYLQEMLKLDEKEKFEKYKADHPELLFFSDWEKEVFYSASARYLRRVARDLSELGKKQDLIYKATDISPQEKRRLIDEIDILKTDIARKVLNLLLGKEPQLLQDSINESIKKLGEIIEETPVLSLEKPDIFDMRKLHTDFGDKLEAATKEDLVKMTGMDPLAFAYLEVKGIEKTIDPIPNKNIYQIMPDLKEGVTFEDYYKAWQGGIIKDEVLDNLSRRQVELLRQYHGLDKTSQKQFLIDNPELAINPRTEWLKSHPQENAQLAIWGQAKILTLDAYNEFKRLIKELDIPDNAIPELTLPPEGSIEVYFERNDIVDKWGANSWEDKLLRAKNPELNTWLELGDIDTPIASLELKVKNRELFDKLDAFSDKDSPDYIADDKARAETIKKFRADNPEFVDDMRRIEAIEKGTNEAPVDDVLVNAHVEYGRLIDQEGIGSSSAEVMLYRVDNPYYNTWRMNTNVWGDNALKPIDRSRIPIWRIDVKYSKEDAEYQAILDKYEGREESARTKTYLEAHSEYRDDRRRRDAYDIDFPENLIDDYAEWYTNPKLEKPEGLEGTYYEDDWWLMEHPEFHAAMVAKGIWKEPRDFSKVPSREIWDLYQTYQFLAGTDERLAFRIAHPDLDAWLVETKGYKPATGRVTGEIESWREALAKELADLSRRIAEMKRFLPQ